MVELKKEEGVIKKKMEFNMLAVQINKYES
jgi:hypothetical protein